jgi:hypothetical protein
MPTTSSPKSDAAASPVSTSHRIQSFSSVRTDWVVVLLPIALGISTFSGAASLLALGVLGLAAIARRTQLRRSMQAGPFTLLVASAAVVLTRPGPNSSLVFFVFLVLVALLVIQLVITVDARVLIASLIDGAGVYLIVNVLGLMAGLRSPSAGDRIAYSELNGFVRTIFPFSYSLDAPPTIASVYVAAAAFLLFDRGWIRRSFRLACFVAAFAVLSQAGDRTSLLVAVILPVMVFCIPLISRWLAQAVTLFASVSALFLPSIMSSVALVAGPFLSFIAPGRVVRSMDITSLSGRDFIWRNSINYWINDIDGIQNRLLGFGIEGQYRSGASRAYADWMVGTVRDPLHVSVHNSFLQQLFDGGLAGWLLLTLAIFWASVRLARRKRDWGPQGVAAIVAIVALLVNAMTQVSIAPGIAQPGFWLLVVLVGVCCQTPGREDAQTGASRQQPMLREPESLAASERSQSAAARP